MTYGIYLSLSDLLSMVISRLIHIAVNGINSSFFMAEYYSIIYLYQIFFIHSPADGHLGCLHVLAIVNSAASLLPSFISPIKMFLTD